MRVQNFTEEIKREVVKAGFENACCKTAALAAFLRTAGSIVKSGDTIGFEFITENDFIAEFFIGFLEDLFGAELKIVQATTDSRNGKDRLVFRCLSDRSLYILEQLGIVRYEDDAVGLLPGVDKYVVENDCCRLAFIKGAFLGSGSCVLPKEEGSRTGYHLEVILFNRQMADDYCEILAEYEILARCVERKGAFVVYLKSRESISDFLALIGADKALEKLDALASRKDERNNINRVANCMQSNLDKSVQASVRQIRAIEAIRETVGLDCLDEPLRRVAEARLQDKEASLKELAEGLQVSKSGLNHRLRRLEKIAEDLTEG